MRKINKCLNHYLKFKGSWDQLILPLIEFSWMQLIVFFGFVLISDPSMVDD